METHTKQQSTWIAAFKFAPLLVFALMVIVFKMDLLLAAVQDKDTLHKEMLEKILKCAKCDKYES